MFAKTFRNTLIASTLVVAGSVLASPAMADGSVTLSGEVMSTTAVDAVDTAGAATLDLHGDGVAGPDTVVKVADLGILSNNLQGVTVTATADDAFTGTTDGTSTLAYKVLIVANDATPAAGDFLANSDSDTITVGAGGLVDGVASRDLFIEYDAPAVLDHDVYDSSITVIIADI